MTNTKSTQLLFLDVLVDDDALGRIFIEPAPNCSTSFVSHFRKTHDFNNHSEECFANVCEVKRHSHVKFDWALCSQTESANVPIAEDLPDEIAATNVSVHAYSDFNSGIVCCDEPGQSFFILTTRWSSTDVRNRKVVGRVFKGMSIVGHLSSIDTNSSLKPLKACKVTNIGVVPPGCNLGLKRRDALLDQYPSLPQDATSIDFLDIDRVINVGYAIKSAGSLLFRQEKYHMAMCRFNKAVRYLTYAGEKQKLAREQEIRLLSLVVPCILNSAACKIKCKDFDGALEDCNEALEINPGNAKILFRRGQAQHGKMNYEQSLADLYTALKLAPNDKSIKNEIAAVEGEMQVYVKRKASKDFTVKTP